MTTAPLIETGRLRPRPHRRDDFAALHAPWRDPAIHTHITGRPSTPEESWARLLRYAGHWQLMGFGYWAIEEKASADFIGWGRRNLAAPEYACMIAPENAASVALAVGLGFHETARTLHHGQPAILMRLGLGVRSPGPGHGSLQLLPPAGEDRRRWKWIVSLAK